MHLVMKRIRTIPPKEIVLALVVVSVAMLGVMHWLDALEHFGRSRWKEGGDGIWGVLFWSLLTWGVMRDPAKWGFRVGILIASIALLTGAFAAWVLWIDRTRPGGVPEPFGDIGVWQWFAFWSAWAALTALSASALSLRWLYRPKPMKA